MAEAPPIKRRNAVRTKACILAAAQHSFAEMGYSKAGIRDIAGLAGVDAAMIIRYFVSKAKLFEAALVDAMLSFDDLDLSHAGFGARLAKRLMEPVLDLRSLAMTTLSVSDPEARSISQRVMEEYGVKPLAEWLGPPNARARAISMLMMTTGFMLYTRQIALMHAEDADESGSADWLAKGLQAIIDND